MQSSMYWGFFLVYTVETFIEVLICVYIDVFSDKPQSDTESAHYATFWWINRIFLVVFCAIIVAFPLGMLLIYGLTFKKWEDESFEKKYGSVLENMNLKKAASLFYPFFFLLRRIGMLWVSLYDHEHVYL